MKRPRGRSVRTSVLALAGSCSLTLAAVLVLPGSAGTADAAACPTTQFVGVRGSGETATDGEGYGPLVNTVRQNVVVNGTIEYKRIDYTAVSVPDARKNPFLYMPSVNDGKAKLTSFLTNFHGTCASTPIVLAGYSQGAHVAADVFQEIDAGVRARIVGIVLFGDPRFNPDQRGVDRGNYNSGLRGLLTPVLGARTFAAAQVGYVHSYCQRGDPICNDSQDNRQTCEALGNLCPHVTYATRPTVDDSYALRAANFLSQRIDLFSMCIDPNSVSPNGSRAALAVFQSRFESTPASGPYLMNTTTRAFQPLPIAGLAPSTVGALSWSPDGLRIAFTYVDPVMRTGPATGIYVVGSAGGTPRQVVSLPLTGEDSGTGLAGFGSPVWSRDGTRLAYTLSRETGFLLSTSLAVVPVAAGNPTEYPTPGDSVAWTPDGRYLVSVAYDGLRAQPVAGGPSVRITTPVTQGVGVFEYGDPVYVSNAWNVFYLGGIRPGPKFSPHEQYRAPLRAPENRTLIAGCVPTSIYRGVVAAPPPGFPIAR